jgi:predicted O-methyltransferase YrrM
LAGQNSKGEKVIQTIKDKYPWPQYCPERDYFMHGWLKDENKKCLAELLNGVQNQLVLEIGCWLGLSAEFMLNLRQDLELVTVDTFKGSAELKSDRQAQDIIKAGLYDQAVRNLWLFKNRLTIVKDHSGRAIPKLGKLGLKPDLVYIDGSHQYADALNDISLSLACFPDAVICGDDYTWQNVRNALRQLQTTHKIKINDYRNFWMIE